MQSLWQQISTSPCGTYHTLKNKPLYKNRFSNVLKFHDPGYAAVKDATASYHINIAGEQAYPHRFLQTFGFYNHRAAVEAKDGWYHILSTGAPVYPARYAWAGNFQENKCVIRDQARAFFHIDLEGNPLYKERYTYAGDYKDGIAVVYDDRGRGRHIDSLGNFIHEKAFLQLDIFHKGFARARDEDGWFHVDRKGNPAYKTHFANIEPFYNGIAHAEQLDGALVLINENGQVISLLSSPTQDHIGLLSSDMVGFWKTYIIWACVVLRIPDFLPASVDTLAQKTSVSTSHLIRLLRALWEIDLVVPNSNQIWELTKKGSCLTPTNRSFMAAASHLWVDVNTQAPWLNLPEWIQSGYTGPHQSFKELMPLSETRRAYHDALKGYAQKDFDVILQHINWNTHKKVISIGPSGLALLKQILTEHSHLQGLFITSPSLESLRTNLKQLEIITQDLTLPWPKKADAIIVPRFLHYGSDTMALTILNRAKNALRPNGFIYILEIVLPEDSPSGGMLDLNMLIETGGQERNKHQWDALFKVSNLYVTKIQALSPLISLMILQPHEGSCSNV